MRWLSPPLAEVLETSIGGVWGKPPGQDELDVDVLRVTELRRNGLLDPSTAAYRSITRRQFASRALRPGDLLLEKSGGGPTTPVGRVGLVTALSGPAVCSNFMQLMRPNPEVVEPRFLHLFLNYLHSIGETIKLQTASTNIRNIKSTDYFRVRVPLPHLSEQRAIVRLVEEHLSRLDAGTRYADSAAARSRSLMRSILFDAVPARGRPGWRLISVADAGTVDLGRQRHPDWHNGPEMRPYLRVANVFENRIDTSDVKSMDFSGVFERFRLHVGDVLLNEGQSPHLLGRPAMYLGDPPDVAFTNSILRFRASAGVLPEWALLVFRRHMHSGRFTRESRITTNIAHLSAKRFKSVEFPLPDLEEQRRIIDLVNSRLEGVGRLTAEAKAIQRRAIGLRKSLLRDAFAGRLTRRQSDLQRVEEAR